MRLDKQNFYKILKRFASSSLPIEVNMRINGNNDYAIILNEVRNTIDNVQTYNFVLQIIDTRKTGYEKYICDDITFNLLDENINTDFRLYKFINIKINEVLGGDTNEKNEVELKNIS